MRIAYISLMFPKLRETFVYNEVRELRAHGIEVQVFSLLRPEADRHLGGEFVLSEEAEGWRRETHYVPPLLSAAMIRAQVTMALRHPMRLVRVKAYLLTRRHRNAGSWLRTVKRLIEGVYLAYEIERNGGVDHIHASFAHHPATAALVASRLTGIPWSFTSHAIDIYYDHSLLAEKLADATFNVTISEYNRDTLKAQYPAAAGADIHVIRLGVDLSTPHSGAEKPLTQPSPTGRGLRNGPSPQDARPPKRILSVAALDEFKGFPWLIRACARLAEGGVPFECDIVGEGPMRRELEELVRELHLEDRVRLLGAQPQEKVRQLLEIADIFCLGSIIADNGERDGIPVVLMEAMAWGLPIVSTTVSGIPEAVEHAASGFLVEPRDADALATRLRELIENDDLRRAFGARGRVIAAERFDLKMNTVALARLFAEKAGRKPGTA